VFVNTELFTQGKVGHMVYGLGLRSRVTVLPSM